MMLTTPGSYPQRTDYMHSMTLILIVNHLHLGGYMFHLYSETSCPKTSFAGEVPFDHALRNLRDPSVQAEADTQYNEVL